MSRYDHNRSAFPAPQPVLGAREITRFDGAPANDNANANSSAPWRERQGHRFALPAVAFLSGLGAASLVALAEHWLGL